MIALPLEASGGRYGGQKDDEINRRPRPMRGGRFFGRQNDECNDDGRQAQEHVEAEESMRERDALVVFAPI